MIRWLYLCNDLGIPLDGTKGASEHVRAITRALSAAGQDVHVLAPRGRLPDGHPATRLDHPCGTVARELGDTVRPWLELSGAPAGMASELAQIACDATLCDAMLNTDLVPPVDVVLERLSLFSAAGRALAKQRGVPHMVEMNAPMACEAARFRDAGLHDLARRVERTTLLAADTVLTVSNELRRYVIDEIGVSADRVVTVPNGVDIDLFSQGVDAAEARRRARVPADAIVFAFVGSLKPWHGLEVLLQAYATACRVVRKAHLLIIGDGRTTERLRALAAEAEIEHRVTWLGGISHDEVAQLLSAVDVALAPYLPQDNFYFSPLKVYEYLAAGRCTIASRAGQIREIIDDGHNGLLVEPGDIDSLAVAMIRAGCDAALRARLGAAAQRSVMHCGWDRTAETVISMARDILRRRAPADLETVS